MSFYSSSGNYTKNKLIEHMDTPDQCWRKMKTSCEKGPNGPLTDAGSEGTGLDWFVDHRGGPSAACTSREDQYNKWCGVTAADGVETHWGQKPTTPPTKPNIDKKPNKGALLHPNQYLATDEYLVSDNKAFFAVMQNDGNFVVYKGSGPTDNKGVKCSSETGGGGISFAVMQNDGNFVIYKGSGPTDNKGEKWSSVTSDGGISFAVMQNDGNFVVYKGSGLADNKGLSWSSEGGNAIEKRIKLGNKILKCPECPTTECPTVECPTTECPTVQCPTTECPTVQCPTVQCPTCNSEDKGNGMNNTLILLITILIIVYFIIKYWYKSY